MRISFELNARDLAFFRREMRRAKEALRVAEDEEIIAAAREGLARARAAGTPQFVQQRLDRLEPLAAMLEDRDWTLPAAVRRQALAALAYFGDPEDLVPDQVPGVGYLDDAIVVELACRELRHELDGFRDFSRYRETLACGPGRLDRESYARRLSARRAQLRARIRRRKQKDPAAGRAGR